MANVGSQYKFEQADKTNPHVIWGYIEWVVTHADLTAAAVTEALDVSDFPADAMPLHSHSVVAEYFTGGTVSACTQEVGDAGDPNGLQTSHNVFDTTVIAEIQHAPGVEAEGGATGPVLEAAYVPQVLFTAVGDNVVNLGAGRASGRVHYKRFDFSRSS